MVLNKKIIVIGGGASGFFYAINHKEKYPDNEVIILEKTANPMQKIKLSGGGRCNITNANFIIRDLVKNYPRGYRELPSIFARFQPADTFEWFEKRGVNFIIEADMRVFPETNTSQTIIDCLWQESQRLGVKVYLTQNVKNIKKDQENWHIITQNATYETSKVIIATGGSKPIWNILRNLEIPIINPVPSLFTFKTVVTDICKLMGVSIIDCQVQIEGFKAKTQGSILITHWGFSGPAILKLSSFLAPELAGLNYKFKLIINWLSENKEICIQLLKAYKEVNSSHTISTQNPFQFPKRLWILFLEKKNINYQKTWREISYKQLQDLAEKICQDVYEIDGKSTHKDEFVTAGGVDLKAIDCKNMQVKSQPNLYLIGEALNIDALTGGYNFQNAWSTAWIAAQQN